MAHPTQCTPDPDPVRIYLLDDHELVRRGLRHLFEEEPGMEVIGDTGTATQAVDDIVRLRPDVAVLDVRLAEGSGIDVCREVHARAPGVQCLMLATHGDDEALFEALQTGATGYAVKEIDGGSLINSVRSAAAGKSAIDSATVARMVAHRDKRGTRDQTPPELSALSRTEREILALIAEGLTNRQIGERIYLAEKTVKNHVTSILAKLGLSRRTEAAVLAARLL